jgi:hypothetical protein
MSNQIPIVQFFAGNQPWIKISLDQAERFGNEVVLIGDPSSRKETKNHFNYSEFNQGFLTFLENYEHLSTNSFDFETSALQRYFVIKEWMLKTGKDKVFITDSDVMIYANLTHELYEPYLQGTSAALCIPNPARQEDGYYWTASGHLSFWTLPALISFIEFCQRIYSSESALIKEKHRYHQVNRIPGGICDMTILYLWSKNDPQVANLLALPNGLLVDHSININDDLKPNQYEMKSGIKSVYFLKGIPYASGTQNRFLILHFQGRAKALMYVFRGGALRDQLRALFYNIPGAMRPPISLYHSLQKIHYRLQQRIVGTALSSEL